MYTKINFISLLFFSIVGFAQEKATIDSLLKVNQHYLKEDTTKVNLLIRLSGKYQKIEINKSIEFIDEAIILAKKINTIDILAKVYIQKARALFTKNLADESLEATEMALKYAKLANDSTVISGGYHNIGNIYSHIKKDLKKAREYYEKALPLAKNFYALGSITYALGNVCLDEYDFLNAEKYYQKSLLINQQGKSEVGMANANSGLALLYLRISNFPLSLEYAFKTAKVFEKNLDYRHLAHNYEQIGWLYQVMGDLKQSSHYYQKTLELNEKGGWIGPTIYSLLTNTSTFLSLNEFDKAVSFTNRAIEMATKSGLKYELSKSLTTMGIVNTKIKKYNTAINNFEKSIEIAKEFKNKSDLAFNYSKLASCYFYCSDSTLQQLGIDPNKRLDIVIDLNLKALDYAQSISENHRTSDILHDLSIDYEMKKDYVRAYEYYKKYIDLRDKVQGDAVKKQITRKEIQFDFDKKEAEMLFKQQITAKNLENQKLLTSQQAQELLLRNQTIILQNQNLNLANKEKDLQRLAYLKEKAEKQEKEQALLLAEKDIKLQDSELAIMVKEKAFQIQALAKKNATIGFLIASLLGLALALLSYYLWQKQKLLKQDKTNNMNFTKQLLETTEVERKRIATDLHDSISHELLNLKSIFKQDIGVIDTKIDSIINDIRGISRNLHPVMFDKIGLVPNIEQLVERIQTQNDFFINTEINYSGSLSSAEELQIYRIIQEALTNIVKYAKAHAAKITISENKGLVAIEIKDNGKGFNVKETLNSGKAFGLHNIVERSRAIGGEAQIDSTENGTSIHIKIPKKA